YMRQIELGVLMYHGVRLFVSAGEYSPYLAAHIPVRFFEEHLRFLKRYYVPVSLKDVLAWQKGSARLPKNACLLTFDDGYESVYTLGYPLLARYDVPATVFLTTGFLDKEKPLWSDRLTFSLVNTKAETHKISLGLREIKLNFSSLRRSLRTRSRLAAFLKHAPQEEREQWLSMIEKALGGEKLSFSPSMPEFFRPLLWEDVRAMSRDGLVTFGAHTCNHLILSRCQDETIAYEIALSKKRIQEELPLPCEVLAYPNGEQGDFDKRAFFCLEQCGYKAAFSAQTGFNKPFASLWEIKRIAVSARLRGRGLLARLALMPDPWTDFKRQLLAKEDFCG
ncbi:MAG: polysaccharide deacetylase family protein, partial [Candidatus Omnitrophica bacterium]|nr:polysaccharide deacetylase family protein [Candidatus Omnitrophota bacterium]